MKDLLDGVWSTIVSNSTIFLILSPNFLVFVFAVRTTELFSSSQAMNPSISLFRSLLREAKKVDNYNFRLYAIRRVKLGFNINRNLTGYVSLFVSLFLGWRHTSIPPFNLVIIVRNQQRRCSHFSNFLLFSPPLYKQKWSRLGVSGG